MAIGLRLLAKLDAEAKEPKLLMDELAAWVRRRCAALLPEVKHATVRDRPALFCHLHPAAEEVELTLRDARHLAVSASTSSVGPGYHLFLASMLKDLGREFQATWQPSEDDAYGDETGYFFSGDEQRAFGSMTEWLQRVAKLFFDGTLDPGQTGIALSLSPTAYFESEQPAITPLGPRSGEWVRRTAEDGANGRDFFAWWKPALDAEYYLGRALSLMWTAVRWRPAVNEGEETVLKTVADSLAEAYRLDPTLPYPWAEWREVLELVDGNADGHGIPLDRAAGPPTIGYRRRNVTVSLTGGWRVRVAGSFSDFEFNSHNDLFALDPPREIWFTSFARPTPESAEAFEATVNKLRQRESTYFVEGNLYAATATVTKKTRKTGEDYIEMNSLNVCPYSQAVLTIIYSEAAEADWAVETWKSLRPPSPPRPKPPEPSAGAD